jgi:hypothetical protein
MANVHNTKENSTILESLNDLLTTHDFAPYVIDVMEGCTALSDDLLLVVLALKCAKTYVKQWGLDIMGSTEIVAEDKDGHRWPVALIITSAESSKMLAQRLGTMHTYIEKELAIKSTPIVQIPAQVRWLAEFAVGAQTQAPKAV